MLAAAEVAIAHDGTHYDQFFTAGYAHFRLGDLDKAQTRLLEAIQLLRADRSTEVQGAGFQERLLHALGLVCHISQQKGKMHGALANEYRQKLHDLRAKGQDPRPLGPWEYELGF
jgi:hypothetical protein